MMRHRQRDLLQSVARALLVLEAIAHRPGDVTPKQLSTDLGLHLSTVYHLLNTLCRAGYAVQDPTTRLFRLGPRIPWLNHAFLTSLSVPAWIGYFLRTLRDATGETAMFGQWLGNHVVFPGRVEGTRPGSVTGGYEGFISPPTETAAGRVLLAWASEDRLRACLKAVGHPLKVCALQAELDQIRTVGYAVDRGQDTRTPKVSCVAAPVVGAGGDVAQALSIIGVSSRFDRDEQSLVRVVVSIARSASAVAAEIDADWPSDDEAIHLDLPAFKAALDAALNAEPDAAP